MLLVIAADEFIKLQTREHFEICKRAVGIPRGIVALTKCDLIDPEVLELVRLETEEFVRGVFFGWTRRSLWLIVPVSPRRRARVSTNYAVSFIEFACETPAKSSARYFRLAHRSRVC